MDVGGRARGRGGLHHRDGALAAHYPVAVGSRGWATPLGAFTVRERELNPTWDVPLSIQEEMRREGRPVLTTVPPGPANPLGRHWLRLTLPGVGIHGTNAPSSIYRSTTHGCIRMHPDDVAALFDVVSEGDAGRAIYEPVLVAVAADGQVFLEVRGGAVADGAVRGVPALARGPAGYFRPPRKTARGAAGPCR